jgi:hypothetical protein
VDAVSGNNYIEKLTLARWYMCWGLPITRVTGALPSGSQELPPVWQCQDEDIYGSLFLNLMMCPLLSSMWVEIKQVLM